MQECLVGAMRDDVDALARDVQRARTTKDERITANTVMRAVQLLMDIRCRAHALALYLACRNAVHYA
jgi:hypothetical protein